MWRERKYNILLLRMELIEMVWTWKWSCIHAFSEEKQPAFKWTRNWQSRKSWSVWTHQHQIETGCWLFCFRPGLYRFMTEETPHILISLWISQQDSLGSSSSKKSMHQLTGSLNLTCHFRQNIRNSSVREHYLPLRKWATITLWDKIGSCNEIVSSKRGTALIWGGSDVQAVCVLVCGRKG